MNEWKTLSHVKWECKYHLIFVPEYRKRVIYGRLRREIGPVLRELFRQKGVDVLEGYAMPDQVHICVSIQTKFSVAEVVSHVKLESCAKVDGFGT